MLRKRLGTILVLLAAVSMAVTVFFFKSHEYYDWIRRITGGMFLAGSFLLPTYSAAEKRN